MAAFGYNKPQSNLSGNGIGVARYGTGRIWIARVLVALVFFINVQCALQFILWPEAYTAAYQVEGASAVRPDRYRVLFGVVIAQQAIGLVGESLLLASLGPGLEVLAGSVIRFIAFDAAGLVLLAIAFALTRQKTS